MNVEIWKDIDGFEGYYQISNFGRVKSLDRSYTNKFNQTFNYKGKILSLTISDKGYYTVSLSIAKKIKTLSVHRLVALAFINTDIKGLIVNHKDHNKLNNHYSNLEWCTYLYNNQHGFSKKATIEKLGTKCKIVNIITNTINIFNSMKQAADSLGINDTTVRKYINNGKTYNNKYIFKRHYA